MDNDLRELRDVIADRGRVHTPWSGAVRMADGVDYHGSVWHLGTRLFVFYRNDLVRVAWDEGEGAYVRLED